jgi:hypothetical protein
MILYRRPDGYRVVDKGKFIVSRKFSFHFFFRLRFVTADKLDKKSGPRYHFAQRDLRQKSQGESMQRVLYCSITMRFATGRARYPGALGRSDCFVLCEDSGGAVFSALLSREFFSSWSGKQGAGKFPEGKSSFPIWKSYNKEVYQDYSEFFACFLSA